MKKYQVNSSGGNYDVVIDSGLLEHIGALIQTSISVKKMIVITDFNVDRLYADIVMNSLERAGISAAKYVFNPGEENKTIQTVLQMLDFLAQQQMTRSDVILALGGGICGDMAGFTAAIYLRGIRFLQVPTTILAAIDASVGGKTAVNLSAGKNLAGAFWQPSMVLCDPQTFSTLPPTVFSDGMAEMIKHGMIADKTLFHELQENRPENNWENIILQNISVKAGFVARDTRDTGIRQLLNFGHTFGHAIEKCSHYSISHGHAVAIGMMMAARAAEKKGICLEPVTEPLKSVLDRYHLPTDCPFTAESIVLAALQDKKRFGDRIQLVLPERIGQCLLYPVVIDDLADFVNSGIRKD